MMKIFLKFTSKQRKGIFLLVIIIITIQTAHFFIDFSQQPLLSTSKQEEWFSLQADIDSLKKLREESTSIIRTFNPNFITDFKGYKLGMTTEEIDRFLEFRKTNKYINSALEFQKITKVSDSLLKVMTPQFKFPNWTVNKKKNKKANSQSFVSKQKKIELMDINRAAKEDLEKVYGIGAVLSERIIKQREKLEFFVDMEQIKYIWGLSSEVIENLNKHFRIIEQPTIKKININDASVEELLRLPYFNYKLIKDIITYRSMNNGINNIDDLIKIDSFPIEKIKIISLYLEF